jgi:6,7-dimethyl-8-ribityllumazine synthase
VTDVGKGEEVHRAGLDDVRVGAHDARGLRFAIVAARFNDSITTKLVDGAVATLLQLGADSSALTLAWVPGAFELPLAAQRFAATGDYVAVICLGTVIRGETAHFEFVAGECAAGLRDVALKTGVPVLFGVLTTENVEQAEDRAGGRLGNKGSEVAQAAVEMARLLV